MKKTLKLFLLICSSLLITTSCNFSFGDLLGNENSEIIFTPNNKNSTIYDGYYQPKSVKYDLQDLNSQLAWVTSETTGNQKLLVVPVQLKNEEAWTETKLETLEKAFFSTNDSSLAFYSVSEYFSKSSYGELSLSGEIYDVFYSTKTKSNLRNSNYLSSDILAEEFNNSTHLSSEKRKEYDLNKDGYIDNIIFVYSNQIDNDDFWAWCTYLDTSYPVISNPEVNNYMWASYYFLELNYEDNYNSGKYETHTYIHETGHLLGLDDYYNYDGEWNPAGKAEMQSYNIGDHNIYSKFALGWVKPYIVTSSCEITLGTSSKYPHAVMINDKWNGSAFDEYILIEYYTPTELNYIDSIHSLEGVKMYDEYGLRIYHIDARLIKLSLDDEGRLYTDGYSDVLKIENDSAYYIGASNSYSYSYLPSSTANLYKYVHILDSAYSNKINNGNGPYLDIDEDDVIWQEGSTFTPHTNFFYDGKFNSGDNISYSISVKSVDGDYCTIEINKL